MSKHLNHLCGLGSLGMLYTKSLDSSLEDLILKLQRSLKVTLLLVYEYNVLLHSKD